MYWVEGFHRLNNPDTLNESFLAMYVHLASRAQDGKAKYTAVKQKENCKPLADVVCKDTTWRAPVRKEHFLRSPPKTPKDIRLLEKTSDTTFEYFWKDMQPLVEKKQ